MSLLNGIDKDIEKTSTMKLVEISFHEKYNVFDVQLMDLSYLSKYDFVELDISFFPLSRKIKSEDYEFEPFEHYIDETKITTSMYRKQQDLWQHVSGLGTAAILTGIVANFNPKNITETDSIATLVVSYLGGMKSWPTIESFFINKSAKWKMQFKERYYEYMQNIASTGEKYDNYAKKNRYKMENIRPDQIGLVIDSVRQKMRLRFKKEQLLAIANNVDKANVMNISFPEELRQEFFKRGMQIGVHIKLGTNTPYFPMIKTRTELIQTLICEGGKNILPKVGCIPTEKQGFQAGMIEHRETIAIDRIKYYKSFSTHPIKIIDYNYKPYVPSDKILVPESTIGDNL